MTNIELYINKQLCDIVSAENLGIRLNRILLNPAELSLRDSQYSYSITIPSTPTNDLIFGYSNVEEVKNKFNRQYAAILYIDEVKIFEGNFRLSEIDKDGNYKGNLVVLAQKTVKEIFGDKKMNEAGEWWVDIETTDEKKKQVESFPRFISRMNSIENSKCIFPLVLYGLLPKQPQKQKEDGEPSYTGKTEWDDTVRLGIEDFPPSINCMQTIRHIFESTKDDRDKPVSIGGSAFDDPRLLKLYMSYQNPVDYPQPWHWGALGKMHLKGKWTNIKNDNKKIENEHLEPYFYQTNSDTKHLAVNLFHSKNAEVTVLQDLGNNIVQYDVSDDEGKKVKQITNVRIPFSGLYKITLKGEMAMIKGEGGYEDKENYCFGYRFAYSNSYHSNNEFSNIRYELKLLRSRSDADFDMSKSVIDGVYFKNNQRQDIETDKNKDKDNKPKFDKYPMYFPKPSSESVLFVDQAQNPHFVCGFRWGISDTKFGHNPIDKEAGKCSVLAAKSGLSWDASIDTENVSAVSSPPYDVYGIIGGEDIPDANADPNEEKTTTELEEPQIDYEESNRFGVEVDKSPKNEVKMKPMPVDADPIMTNAQAYADGKVHMIVWLEKGEMLTLADVNDEGIWRSGERKKGKEAYIKHAVTFDLEIEPFRTDKEWVKVGLDGTGIAKMNWEDESNVDTKKINLARFLPSEQKIDEWLDNFCKAFNLQLTQPEPYKFELDVRPVRSANTPLPVINLDNRAHVLQSYNQPLGLPSEFKLGFKINKDEEGYMDSDVLKNKNYEDGGGSFSTGSIDGQAVTQNSNFSYNWYKEITHKRSKCDENLCDPNKCNGNNGGECNCDKNDDENKCKEIKLMIPVITHNEIWLKYEFKDYAEMQSKLYTQYSQRFWYFDRLYDAEKVWDNGKNRISDDAMQIALVKNKLDDGDRLSLDYHDKKGSILKTYFNIIASNDSNYTYVECYLTPDEYERLSGAAIVQFNGDLYYVAAVEGYDPTNRDKTKLKLIRKL